jgi:hypothetical protein
VAIDRVRIDGKTYILAPGQEAADLKAAIEAAAKEGARFVDFTAVGGHTISVLISAGVAVRIESIEVSEDEGDPHGLAHDAPLPGQWDEPPTSDFYDV